MQVKGTRRALRDLDEAFEWIVADNPRAATEVIDRLRSATRLLADNPRMGRPGGVPDTRELVVSRTPYVVMYRIRSDQVQILTVLHHARERPTFL